MKIIGIDPGKNGAIVVVDFEFANMFPSVKFYDIPTYQVETTARTKKGNLKKKTKYNIGAITEILNEPGVSTIVIEEQQAFPGQGSVSMFNIGKGYGMYLGIINAYKYEPVIVRPKEWQKYYGISGKKGDTKHQAYLKACELFPDYADELKTPRGRIIDGRCDSLLMAAYEANYIKGGKE